MSTNESFPVTEAAELSEELLRPSPAPSTVASARELLTKWHETSSHHTYCSCSAAYRDHFHRELGRYRALSRLEQLNLSELQRAQQIFDEWLASLVTIPLLASQVPSVRQAADHALFHVIQALMLRRRKARHDQIALKWEAAAGICESWLTKNKPAAPDREWFSGACQ